MEKLADLNLTDFTEALSSKAPVPGGGGASALAGALAAALCMMVGNLTAGKKKYADFLCDMRYISVREAQGVKIAHYLTERDDIDLTLDPTLLLDLEIWENLFEHDECGLDVINDYNNECIKELDKMYLGDK